MKNKIAAVSKDKLGEIKPEGSYHYRKGFTAHTKYTQHVTRTQEIIIY